MGGRHFAPPWKNRLNMQGLLITFEGPDKAGKSTQIRKLTEWLESLGRKVLSTREPGGTALSERLRDLVMQFKTEKIFSETELMLFASSRAQLMRQVILPELEAGTVVLCDRFADSTYAYQGCARGLDKDFIRRVNDFVLGGRWPDATFLLDLSVQESFRRLNGVLGNGEGDRFEDEKEAFHQKVRDGFLELAATDPQRITVVDATKSIDEVFGIVRTRVEALLQ